MRRVLASLAVAVAATLALGACSTGGGATGTPAPHASEHSNPPSERPTPSPSASIVPALWGYKMTGVGPAVLATHFPASAKTVTVRWTCVGDTKRTEIRSAKGGLFIGTLGCAKGVIYSSYGARSTRRDPTRIAVKVEPGVQWAVEVWAGKYSQPAALAA